MSWSRVVLNLTVASLLFVVLGVPLWLGRVRRNVWYGVRTPTSLSSDANWAVLNRGGGRIAVMWGVVIGGVAVAVATFGTPGSWSATTHLVITLAPVVGAAVHVTAYTILTGRRLRGGGGGGG